MGKIGAPYGNKNAEKWTIRKSIQLFNDAIDLTNEIHTEPIFNKKDEYIGDREIYTYDFIGEVARKLGTFHKIFEHLTKRFPALKRLKNELDNNIEANCYYNTKKGNIREATGIVNLKSNWRWTDRTQTDHSISDGSMSPTQPKTLDDWYNPQRGHRPEKDES